MFFIQTLLVSLVAGSLTWLLNCRLNRGPVLSSAVVTLTAGLVLPALFAQGGALAPMAACASYIGMSADSRLGNLWQILAALGLAAVLYVASQETFLGVGGKGGTIAAICVMAVWGSIRLIKILSRRQDTGLANSP
ncbi:MAG: hypothetical protein ACOX2G_06940 [Bacillota bacterium]